MLTYLTTKVARVLLRNSQSSLLFDLVPSAVTKPTKEKDVASAKIPVVEEKISYRTQRQVTGKVRITKQAHHEAVEVDESFTTETAEVTRVPIDRFVDELPTVRQEGDLTIVPVVEEVLVKRLRLVEEIHIQRTKKTQTDTREVSLRQETVEIQRDSLDTKQ